MGIYVKQPKTDIEKAMFEKKTNIAEAQKRKNDAIQIAGLQRDATLLTTAMINANSMKFSSHELVEGEWQHWHDFLQAKLDKQILGF